MVKESSHKKLFRLFLRYITPYYSTLLAIFLLLVIAALGSLASPYALKIIIDQVLPKGNMKHLIVVLSALMIIYIFRIICALVAEVLYNKVGQRIIASIQADMSHYIIHQPITFFKQVKTGDILFILMDDVSVIQNSLFAMVLKFAIDFITLVGIVGMLLVLDFRLASISLIVIPMMLLSLKIFAPHIQKSFHRIQETQQRLNTFFLENIRNHRAIKSYNMYLHEAARLLNLHNQMVCVNVSNALLTSANSSVLTFFVAVGPIIVLIFGGADVFNGALTLGGLVAFIQYLNRIYAPALNLANSINSFNKAIVSMGRVAQFLPAQAGNTLKTCPHPLPDFFSLDLKGVSFSVQEKQIIKDVSMHFEKGKIIGIVGPSGSGKSTIINLICGFLEPTGGSILVDGHTPIHSFTNWCDALGLIEKENQLFHQSLWENVQYGSTIHNDQRMEEAANHSKLASVIKALPQAYDTVINDTGSTLSDGQKQRISIARALYKKPPLIIMDEATASLDIMLEKDILKCLKTFYPDCMVVLVTHRITSLRLCDYVYSLQNGSVIKEGSVELFKDSITEKIYEKDTDIV